MKWDEFAFVNQQLAAMLKDGIPLEGALKQLCQTMARGDLRSELEKLEADLAKGVPLAEALAARKLPEFYVQMIQVGVKSNDLPRVLTMLADYYQRSNLIVTRLKGLMVYPLIVLVGSLGLSVVLAVLLRSLTEVWPGIWYDLLGGETLPNLTTFSLRMAPFFLWGPTAIILLLLVAFVLATTHRGLRRWLRWRMPALRDVSLWQFAAAMEVMLMGGCGLEQALAMMALVEAGSPVATELADWRARLASGHGRLEDFAAASKSFPRLFIWLVSNSGDDLAAGFRRAATVYHGRASYRVEAMLYAALPISILALGGLVFCQVYSLIHFAIGGILPFMSMMGISG